MWKKDEPMPTKPAVPEAEPRIQPPRPGPSSRGSGERATIGPSIVVRGEVGGDEDLLIQGRVEGSVDLKQQSVTVGEQGRVKANIEGRVVTVEGEVEGDLRALDQVILRSSARVQGDITAPRVVLEDGATFRGLVDMGDPFDGKGKAESKAPSGTKTESAPDKAASTTPDSGKSEVGSTQPSSGPDKASSSSQTKNAP